MVSTQSAETNSHGMYFVSASHNGLKLQAQAAQVGRQTDAFPTPSCPRAMSAPRRSSLSNDCCLDPQLAL